MNEQAKPDNILTLFCKMQRASVVAELLISSGQLDLALSALSSVKDFATKIEETPTIKEYSDAQKAELDRNNQLTKGEDDSNRQPQGEPGNATIQNKRRNSRKKKEVQE